MALPLTHKERVVWLMEEVERARVELRYRAAQLAHELKGLTETDDGGKVDKLTSRQPSPTIK